MYVVCLCVCELTACVCEGTHTHIYIYGFGGKEKKTYQHGCYVRGKLVKERQERGLECFNESSQAITNLHQEKKNKAQRIK